MNFKNCLLYFAILLVFLCATSAEGFPPTPFRVGGTVTVNVTPLDQATDTGYAFFLTKEDGTPYVPAAEDMDGLNSSQCYIIDIPIYHEDDQPGGANPGDTAVIHVYKDGSPLMVTSPPNGQIAVGDSGSTDQIDLTVVSPPVINGFSATPDTITENGFVTLAWDISGADSAEISHGIGAVMPSGGSVQDAPTSATAYMLTATNTAGSVTRSVTVTVEETIQYDLAMAIVGQGSVTPPGGTYDEGTVVQLTAVADSGWTFSAWSDDLAGSSNPKNITMNSNKTVTATFTQLPPVINSFSATPDAISKGGFVTLAWDISGADSAEISHGIGAVMPSGGSVQDAPTGTAIYILTAANEAGTISDSVSVNVVSGNSPPVVNAGSHQSVEEGAIVTVAATFRDADPDDTHTATIDWGDGTPVEAGDIGEGYGFGTISAAHIYNNIGPFPVTVCVTDENGAAGCDGFTVTVFSRGRHSSIILEAHFDENDDGFSYIDDPFRNTNEPAYASGSWLPSAGSAGGSLKVTLGGVDNEDILGMSGGWQKFITLDSSTEVVLSFRYKLTQGSEYEPDELGQVLVSINGNVYGDSPNDYVAQVVGNGWGGSQDTTGWRLFQARLGTLEEGRYILTIGGFNSKKTYSNEVTVILIDDVLVTGKHSHDWLPVWYYSNDYVTSPDQITPRTKRRWHHHNSFSNKGPNR